MGSRPPSSMPSLIVQTSFIGDMVLTTPLIAWLAKSGPVDVVATPRTAGLLENHPAVREVIVYDKRGVDRGITGFRRMASRLRASRYGVAYLAQGSVRSGALTVAAGIRDRVGFASSAGRVFYTTRVTAVENAHHAARLLSLATRDPMQQVPASALVPRLYPGAAERTAVDNLLGAAASDDPLIILAPGSIWATKQWPYYAELAHELRHAARIVVVGAESDQPLAVEILDATSGAAIDATGRLSLLASAELIGRAALVVTNDSAPLHLASAMNAPTIAIFGPTVPEFGFGPLAERSEVVGHTGLTCRPCDRHGPRRCPLGHWRCMREITPEHVARMARGLLTTRTS